MGGVREGRRQEVRAEGAGRRDVGRGPERRRADPPGTGAVMDESGTLQVEHLRRLAARLVDPQQTPSQRAAQAELLVQSVEDVRAGLRVAMSVVPGSELVDQARSRAAQM